MTIFTGTITKYAQNGLREDLADVIFNISPEDTPFISGCSRGVAKGVLHEWQTDSLAAATTANAHLEGDDITDYGSISSTVRVGNYSQISRKLVLISGTLEAVDKAGRKSELAYQIAKKGSELKRDMETIALANLGGNAGGPTTARQMATIGAWLKSNTSFDATTTPGVDPGWTSGVPLTARTDGTQRAFTSTLVDNVVASMWSNGGYPKVLMVGSFNKQAASAFTSNVTRNYDISQPKPSAIVQAMDVYVSDFGTLSIVANRFQRARDAFILDYDFCGLAFLRPMKVEKMAKTGDGEKRMLLTEWTLVIKNEAALGAVYDLTTS